MVICKHPQKPIHIETLSMLDTLQYKKPIHIDAPNMLRNTSLKTIHHYIQKLNNSITCLLTKPYLGYHRTLGAFT